jgi:tetratricopeptide (TPR) repeat protein
VQIFLFLGFFGVRLMLIICAGMMRSGSTLQYQIVCEIIEYLGLGMTIGWTKIPSQELLDNLQNVVLRKDKFLVIKSHNFCSEVKALVRSDQAKVVYVYRDLRDVAVSLNNKFTKSTKDAILWLGDRLNNYYFWASIDKIIVSRYENMINDLYGEVLKIAHYLGVAVSNDLAKSISYKLDINEQKQRINKLEQDSSSVIKLSGNDVYDPVSQLHNNHINSGKWGQWKESLSKEQIEHIESFAFSWFVDRGYPLSTFKKDETKTAIEYFRQARKLKQDGKLAEADNSYRQAILLSPRSSLYHYSLGEVLLKLGKVDYAINAYRHAIYLNPNSALSHQGLGVALSQAGQLNMAIDHYRQGVKIKPNTPRFENSLNLALSKQK